MVKSERALILGINIQKNLSIAQRTLLGPPRSPNILSVFLSVILIHFYPHTHLLNDNRNGNQLVAIKRMRNVFDNPNDARRVFREMRILRHIEHPQIVGLLDVLCPGLDDGEDGIQAQEPDNHNHNHNPSIGNPDFNSKSNSNLNPNPNPTPSTGNPNPKPLKKRCRTQSNASDATTTASYASTSDLLDKLQDVYLVFEKMDTGKVANIIYYIYVV